MPTPAWDDLHSPGTFSSTPLRITVTPETKKPPPEKLPPLAKAPTTWDKLIAANTPQGEPILQPIKDAVDYTKQNFKAGAEAVTAPYKPDATAGWGGLKRIGDVGGRIAGAVEAATAPMGAVAHAAVAKPLERMTKLPAEWTDLALAFTPVTVGGAIGTETKIAKAINPAIGAEKIENAAIRLKNGKVYTGDNHADIKRSLPAGTNVGKKSEEGFQTSTGRFVNRKEGGYIAKFGKQTKGDVAADGLHSEDLKGESVFTKGVKGIQSILSPTTMSSKARGTEAIIREQRGWAERNTETARAQVNEFAKQVNGLSPTERRQFLTYVEGRSTGAKLANPELQKAADKLREVFHGVRGQLEGLSEDDKMGFVQDYFPHMWKDSKRGQAFVQDWVSKGGSGKHTKARSLPTIEDGLAKGLEPAEGNLLDHTMQYVGNMQNFIALKKTQAAMSETGLRKFFPQGRQPAGWVELKGPGNRTPHNVAYAPEDAARVYNRNYSSGWTGRTGDVYRGLQAVSNGSVQLKLALSGYHAWLVTNESATAAFTRGVDRLRKGDKAGAARAVGMAAVPGAAAVKNAVLGERVMMQALGKEAGLDRDVIDALTSGGARFKGMDKTMRMSSSGNYWDSWKRGTLKADFKNASFPRKIAQFMDTTMYPLFVKGIPNIKNAVNYEALSDWMRTHPGASREEINQAARTIIDSTDNRFGEMIQDNIFWDKKFKQSLQVIMLSVGWNVGTIREVVGGSKDLAELISKGSDMSPRAQYIIGLPLIHMLNASVYQYLKTGSAPDQPQDLINPKTGGVSPYGGAPERGNIPDNLKDVIAWQKHPLQEAANKMAPIWPVIGEMATQSDWRGDPISYQYMQNAPGFVKGWAEWLLKSTAPISIEGAVERPLKGSNVSRTDRVLGEKSSSMEVENPPAYRDWKKAEQIKKEKAGMRHIQTDEERRQ